MTARPTGVMPPMTTPLGKDDEIDFRLVGAQLEWIDRRHIEAAE